MASRQQQLECEGGLRTSKRYEFLAAVAAGASTEELTKIVLVMRKSERTRLLAGYGSAGSLDPWLCRLLLDNGANPNAQTRDEYSFVDALVLYVLEQYPFTDETGYRRMFSDSLACIGMAARAGASPDGSRRTRRSAIQMTAQIDLVPLQRDLLKALGLSEAPSERYKIARDAARARDLVQLSGLLGNLDETRRHLLLFVTKVAYNDYEFFSVLLAGGADPYWEYWPGHSFAAAVRALAEADPLSSGDVPRIDPRVLEACMTKSVLPARRDW